MELVVVIAALDDVLGVDRKALLRAGGDRGRIRSTPMGEVFVLDLQGDPGGTARFFAVREIMSAF